MRVRTKFDQSRRPRIDMCRANGERMVLYTYTDMRTPPEIFLPIWGRWWADGQRYEVAVAVVRSRRRLEGLLALHRPHEREPEPGTVEFPAKPI